MANNNNTNFCLKSLSTKGHIAEKLKETAHFLDSEFDRCLFGDLPCCRLVANMNSFQLWRQGFISGRRCVKNVVDTLCGVLVCLGVMLGTSMFLCTTNVPEALALVAGISVFVPVILSAAFGIFVADKITRLVLKVPRDEAYLQPCPCGAEGYETNNNLTCVGFFTLLTGSRGTECTWCTSPHANDAHDMDVLQSY